MRIQAKSIVHKKQLIAIHSESEFLYQHFKTKLGFARINLIAKTCTCHKFLDKGICKHLIAACISEKISLSCLVQLPNKFKIIRRQKNRNFTDDSRSQEQMEAAMVEIPPIPIVIESQVNLPKKRGRKPKQTGESSSQIGGLPFQL